jgi:hypothetical protein
MSSDKSGILRADDPESIQAFSRQFVVEEEYVKQWRNVISGGPRFKIFEGPPTRSAKGTS